MAGTSRHEAAAMELGDFMLDLEELYLKHWLTEENVWRDRGIYERLTQTIDDIQEGIHVDIGCAYGLFPSLVFSKTPQRHVIGIDNNTVALHAASETFPNFDVPFQVLSGFRYELDPEHRIIHRNILDYRENKEFLKLCKRHGDLLTGS